MNYKTIVFLFLVTVLFSANAFAMDSRSIYVSGSKGKVASLTITQGTMDGSNPSALGYSMVGINGYKVISSETAQSSTRYILKNGTSVVPIDIKEIKKASFIDGIKVGDSEIVIRSKELDLAAKIDENLKNAAGVSFDLNINHEPVSLGSAISSRAETLLDLFHSFRISYDDFNRDARISNGGMSYSQRCEVAKSRMSIELNSTKQYASKYRNDLNRKIYADLINSAVNSAVADSLNSQISGSTKIRNIVDRFFEELDRQSGSEKVVFYSKFMESSVIFDTRDDSDVEALDIYSKSYINLLDLKSENTRYKELSFAQNVIEARQHLSSELNNEEKSTLNSLGRSVVESSKETFSNLMLDLIKIKEFQRGFTHAVVNDLSWGLVDPEGTGTSQYKMGKIIGSAASFLLGIAEMVGGGALTLGSSAGGAALMITSSGLATPVALPASVTGTLAGVATMSHGYGVAVSSLDNIMRELSTPWNMKIVKNKKKIVDSARKLGFKTPRRIKKNIKVIDNWKPHFKKVGVKSADDINASFVKKKMEPAYLKGTDVIEFKTTNADTWVRVHGPNNQPRNWVMKERDIAGLSPKEIAKKYNIPDIPTSLSKVDIPSGTKIRMGVVGPNKFGSSQEALQFEILMERVPTEWFTKIKDF